MDSKECELLMKLKERLRNHEGFSYPMLISQIEGGYMISNCGESLRDSKLPINDLMILTLVSLMVTILYSEIDKVFKIRYTKCSTMSTERTSIIEVYPCTKQEKSTKLSEEKHRYLK